MLSSKTQISVLTKLDKDFKSICRDTGIKIKEINKISDFTIFEYSSASRTKMLYNIKLVYESYLIEEIFNPRIKRKSS